MNPKILPHIISLLNADTSLYFFFYDIHTGLRQTLSIDS